MPYTEIENITLTKLALIPEPSDFGCFVIASRISPKRASANKS
jgi:hypothetical protein